MTTVDIPDSYGIFTRDAGSYLARGGEVKLEKLTDRVWSATSGIYRTLVIAADTSVIAVNCFGTPAAARSLRAAIGETVPNKEIATLIQTIDHLDHTGAGAELAVSGDVIGHDLAARVIGYRNATGQLPITRRIFGDGESIELDGVKMDLSYPGPTMGTGNLAVTLPDDGILFVVGPQINARYGIFPDYHFRHVTRIWRELADRKVTTVVPGRYGCFDVIALRQAADYLDAVANACQQAFAQGVPIWEVDTMGAFLKAQLQDEFGFLDGFDEHVSAAAIRVVHYYLMGGWGLEDTSAPNQLHV